MLFRVIELAAILQSAGLIGAYDCDEVNRRRFSTKKDPGVGPLLKKLLERTESAQPKIASVVRTWMELVSAVENGETELHRLVDSANIAGY